MQRKRCRSQILGLLVALILLTACGASGGSGTAGTSPAGTTEATSAAGGTEAASPTTETTSAAAAEATSTAGSAESTATTAEATSAPEPAAAGSGETIKVGSKNFTESYILAEMYAKLLETNGFRVERKLRLGATPIAHQALLNNEIDLYPEYTSTGLLTVLNLPQMSDRQQIFDTVKREYEKQFQLTWLEPAPFNNTQALAMTKQRAQELGIKTYTDLSQKAGNLAIGGPPEFLERPDGLPGLQEAYGGFRFRETRQLDPGLRYQALLNGQIDVVVAFGTDGQIGGYDLAVLQDNRNFYPPYQAAPVIRRDTLQAFPQIADILNKLAPTLDDTTMAKLNWMVEGPDKQEPAAVAQQFLTEKGLIK